MQVFEKTTEGGHNFDANPAIKKVVELSTYMHRATKVASQSSAAVSGAPIGTFPQATVISVGTACVRKGG